MDGNTHSIRVFDSYSLQSMNRRKPGRCSHRSDQRTQLGDIAATSQFLRHAVDVENSTEIPYKMIDNNTCQCYHFVMLAIQVIDDPAAATVALEPIRSRLLSHMATPASAATLASHVGLARQKVNYHLNALEAHGLVRLASERKWGGL